MIGILGLVVIIVAAVMAYKTAKQYERSAGLWVAIVIAIGVGFQIVIPVVIGIVMGIVYVLQGNNPADMQNDLDGWLILINVVSILLSVVGIMAVLKYLSKVPEDKPYTAPPAPPESFT